MLDVSGNTVIPLEKDTIQNIKGTNIVQIIDSNTKTSEIYNKKMEKVVRINRHSCLYKRQLFKSNISKWNSLFRL